MNGKKRIAVIGLIALGVVLAISLTWANDSSARPRHRHGLFLGQILDDEGRSIVRNYFFSHMKRHMNLAEDLNLTDEQKSQFLDIIEMRRNDIAPMIADLMEKHQALSRQVLAGQPDEAAIRQAAADLNQAITKASILAADLVREARTILTAEQLELLEAHRTEKQEATKDLLDYLRRPIPPK